MPKNLIYDGPIGDGSEDILALSMAVKSQKINLELVVTSEEINGKRAELARAENSSLIIGIILNRLSLRSNHLFSIHKSQTLFG